MASAVSLVSKVGTLDFSPEAQHLRPKILLMPSFVYVARETGTGKEIRSSVDAATEPAAIAALLNRNLLVVSIQEKITKKG